MDDLDVLDELVVTDVRRREREPERDVLLFEPAGAES